MCHPRIIKTISLYLRDSFSYIRELFLWIILINLINSYSYKNYNLWKTTV